MAIWIFDARDFQALNVMVNQTEKCGNQIDMDRMIRDEGSL